jgi:hypothetical protein
MKARFILIIGIAFTLTACASSAYLEQDTLPKTVAKTGDDNRPEWTTHETFTEKDDNFFYTGGVMGGADYALTLRLARSEATKNLLESVEIKARVEFSNALHGQNRNDSDLGRYVTDAVAWTVDNLRVRGIKQRKIYYEQIFDPINRSVKYNTWVQLEIAKADYLKAKVDSAEKLLEKAIRDKDQEVKEKALELLEKLQQKA